MKEWKETTIGDLCIKITDGSHFSPKEIEVGYPMFSVKDMDENGFDYSSVKRVSKEDFVKMAKGDCQPKKDDLLIAKDGSYLKHVFVCKEEKEETILSSIAILRPNKNKILPEFFKQLLKSSSVKGMMESFVSGSALPRIVLKDFKKMQLQIPPLPIQQRIANILSTYDDLIETNNQRIKLLEETAQQLYKEWFVRMRFPEYKNVRFVKGVPEGWKIGQIGDVCKVARGSSPRPIVDDRFFEGGTIPWIKIADATASSKFILETKQYVNEHGASFSRYLEEGSLIIATSGTLGFCIFLGLKGCIHDGWLYTYDYKKNVKPCYLYYLINSMTEYLNNLSSGAAIQNINTDILRKTPMIIPNKNTLEKFYSIIEPMDELHKSILQQNTQLRQIRDRLLPRLVSGQLVVKSEEVA